MTTPTMSNNGMQRKTLANQIDRLGTILDGLGDTLNEAVAAAVKDAVGEVVREAVQTAVREVLSSPELLRAALAQHEPVAPQVEETPAKPKSRTLKESLLAGWNWLWEKGEQKVAQARQGLGVAWSCCVQVLSQAGGWACDRSTKVSSRCVNVGRMLSTVGGRLWRFRQSCMTALVVGLVCGVVGYLAGPVIAGVLCGAGGVALTLSMMILVPLWRLMVSVNLSEL